MNDSPKDSNFIPQAAEILEAKIGEADGIEKQFKSTFRMFRLRTANECLSDAASQPDPVELYKYLVVENEITFLFGDTGIGKTVLAVQIAIHIANTHKLLYVDLELSDKQFEKRYRNEQGVHYPFPGNFYRLDLTPLLSFPDGVSYQDYFFESLKKAIDKTGAKVVIIDNMTKLVAGDTDSAKAAIPILEKLHKMCRLQGITFLILEHTKKVDNTRPICLNDLQGSEMKANFADAIFSIGKSHSDKYIRYVKQLKVRSADHAYDTDNVMVCEMSMDGGYLHLNTIDYKSEFELLKQPVEGDQEQKVSDVMELHRQGISNREIAGQFRVSEGTIRNWIGKNA